MDLKAVGIELSAAVPALYSGNISFCDKAVERLLNLIFSIRQDLGKTFDGQIPVVRKRQER